MFDLLEVALVVLERLAPVEAKIRVKSRSLANQVAECSESIVLNIGEGGARRGGDRLRHYDIASGSAGELTVALRIALGKRYITAADRASVEEPLDRVRAMLWRSLH